MFLIPSKFIFKKNPSNGQMDRLKPTLEKMTTINFQNIEVDRMFEADVSQAGKLSSFQSKSLGYPQMLTASFWVFFFLKEFFNGVHSEKKPNVAMKHGPFEDVFPIEHGDIPLLCKFARGYHVSIMLYHADLTYLCWGCDPPCSWRRSSSRWGVSTDFSMGERGYLEDHPM